MPQVLWLLEHMRLRVDPLKDAAGSPFGKDDRLCLYLHVQKLCVEWGSTKTAGTSMFMRRKFPHIYKVLSLEHDGMGHLWLKWVGHL